MSGQSSASPLDSIPEYDRVSIRAVLVRDGEDPSEALSQAGIIDAVAIPVSVGDESDSGDSFFGDGMTPNVTGVLEPDEAEDDFDASSAAAPPQQGQQPDHAGQAEAATVALPPAYGLTPLAPVRQRSR